MLMQRLSRSLVAGAMVAAAAIAGGPAASAGQDRDPKPVPKNSVRVSVSGCARGSAFLAGEPSEDQPGGSAVPEGTRLRMNGPKALMREIKGHEGSRIEITGLMRKGQEYPGGINVGGGVRIGAGGGGPAAPMGSGLPTPGGGQLMIDVEGWRQIPGECRR